jgi:hypothetical protein
MIARSGKWPRRFRMRSANETPASSCVLMPDRLCQRPGGRGERAEATELVRQATGPNLGLNEMVQCLKSKRRTVPLNWA